MEKTEEKILFKILAVVLAVGILLVLAGGGFLFFTSGGKAADSGQQKVKKVELKAAMPTESEKKLTAEVTVSAGEIQKGKDAKPEDSTKEDDTKKENEDSQSNKDYIIADSASRLLTNADIAGLSARELNYAKNEIYARHGRKFDSKELRDYFESKSWYQGKYSASDFDANYSAGALSEVEKKNAEFLSAAEYRAESGGYKLDQ